MGAPRHRRPTGDCPFIFAAKNKKALLQVTSPTITERKGSRLEHAQGVSERERNGLWSRGRGGAHVHMDTTHSARPRAGPDAAVFDEKVLFI